MKINKNFMLYLLCWILNIIEYPIMILLLYLFYFELKINNESIFINVVYTIFDRMNLSEKAYYFGTFKSIIITVIVGFIFLYLTVAFCQLYNYFIVVNTTAKRKDYQCKYVYEKETKKGIPHTKIETGAEYKIRRK